MSNDNSNSKVNLFVLQNGDDTDWVLQRASLNNDLTSDESAPNRDHTTNSDAGHYITVTTKRPNFKGVVYISFY